MTAAIRIRRLEWTEHAIQQLGSIAEYISLDSPVYAEQVIDRISRRFRQACSFPESGRVVPEVQRPTVRELIEPPYRLIYQVEEESIRVLSVLHGRQRLGDLPGERRSPTG